MKSPAKLIFDFDTMPICEYQDVTGFYKGDKHEYIRRDLVEKLLKQANPSIDLPINKEILDKAIEDADND